MLGTMDMSMSLKCIHAFSKTDQANSWKLRSPYFIEIIDNFEILSVIGDNLVIKYELIVVSKIRIENLSETTPT